MLQPIARVAERGRIQTEVLPSRKCGKTLEFGTGGMARV